MATTQAFRAGRGEASWTRTSAGEAERTESDLGRRLRYWLNSFRGFAAYDVRGPDRGRGV